MPKLLVVAAPYLSYFFRLSTTSKLFVVFKMFFSAMNKLHEILRLKLKLYMEKFLKLTLIKYKKTRKKFLPSF